MEILLVITVDYQTKHGIKHNDMFFCQKFTHNIVVSKRNAVGVFEGCQFTFVKTPILWPMQLHYMY